MKVFVEYEVTVSALVEKDVPENTSYDDVINSVTREELCNADIQAAEWDHLKYAWRYADCPNIYKTGEDGNIDWSEQLGGDCGEEY